MLNGKFEDVVAIADECYRLQDRIYNGKYNEIGIEVRKRLKQLDKLLDIAIDLHNNLISIKKQTDPPKTLKNIDEMHEWLE
jgi:hypothetical protein